MPAKKTAKKRPAPTGYLGKARSEAKNRIRVDIGNGRTISAIKDSGNLYVAENGAVSGTGYAEPNDIRSIGAKRAATTSGYVQKAGNKQGDRRVARLQTKVKRAKSTAGTTGYQRKAATRNSATPSTRKPKRAR